MYLTKKYLDVGKGSRIIKAEISNYGFKELGSRITLEILSEEPLDETSTKSLTSDWDCIREENIIKLD